MLQSFLDEFAGQAIPPSERGRIAQKLTERCGYAAAALTILPIPGSEILGVMPIHVGMVVGIGHVYGVEITRDSATELLLKIGATVGLSLVGSRIATTAAKIILPGLGGLISAPFMYASTLAIGAVARAYFELEGNLSSSEMRNIYKDSVKQAKQGFDPSQMRSEQARKMAEEAQQHAATGGAAPAEPAPDPMERLQKLKKMLDAGLIEQEEYDSTKQRILSEI